MLKMRGDCCKYTKGSSMLLLFFVALLNFFVALVTAQLTAVVNTSSGPVRGIILSTVNSVPYAAFKGIPYAEPPLGFLRFQPPLPIKPWTMILNATEDGAKCIQPDVISGANTSTSENCLFINVHTTTTNLAVTPRFLKPVMVWIYGGGFTLGSSTSGFYRPDYVLEKGVVYVAFNYRIGPLGFLSLNHPNATGNAGLKDQVLALKWVKENIAKFGGNPNNVTIFGQSAGASSVGYHILSDASTGLFQAAISMSGSPLSPSAFHTPAKSLLQSINFATHLGTYSVNKETLLKTFYDATPEEILAATSKMMFQNIFPFRPTLENKKIAKDVFLTRCSIANYISGNFTKVPQMLGFTDQETVTFVVAAQYLTGIATEVFDTANNFGVGLSKRLTLVGSAINSTTKVLGSLVDATFDEFIEVSTDLLYRAGVDQTQQHLSIRNDGNPVYYYHVSFYTNTSLHNVLSNSTILGAGHADDLAFIFYFPEANYTNDPTDPTRQTIDRVSTMWTNFAKYGNPTPSWVPEVSVGMTWPESGSSGLALNIGNELSIEPRPTNINMKLIQAANGPFHPSNGCFSLLRL